MLHALPPEEATARPCIQPGDLVIVYERFDSMKAVHVELDKMFGNRFGQFKLKDWVGRHFGSKVQATGGGSGWVYLLSPTPELWTQVLKHRTQILYAADIALACTFLELRPGMTVLESGTGSGSMTHALARAVAPTGSVQTFEFHQVRADMARTEFAQHGLGELVTVQQRNIEADGFPEELHGQADALFLDLPRPWLAVPSAAACLRPDGVLCSFSPCIEQVHKTCAALEAEGFFGTRTMECLLRLYEAKRETLRTDMDPPSQPTGRGARRQQDMQAARLAPPGQRVVNPKPPLALQFSAGGMRKRQRPGQREAAPNAAGQGPRAGAAPSGATADDVEGATSPVEAPPLAGGATQEQAQQQAPAACGAVPPLKPPDKQVVLAKPVLNARGHTGYLTFARRGVD